jgi:superoxide oxidase
MTAEQRTGAIDMTKNLELAETSAVETEADDRFDGTSIMLHWLTVLLIVIQFSSAWLRESVDHRSPIAVSLLAAHLNSGVLVWVTGVTRLIWRHNFAYLPPFPPSMPKLQQTIAKVNEYSLYVLLLVQPITGLGRALLRGQPFDLFFWQVPALFEENDSVRHFLAESHEFGAKALLALIGLHAGAALFHRLVLRDGVLQRMLPRMSARAKLAPVLAKTDAE